MTNSPPVEPAAENSLQQELHAFNNQLLRISLLSEAFQWKLQERGQDDEYITTLLGKIKKAVMEVAQSGRNVNTMVKRSRENA